MKWFCLIFLISLFLLLSSCTVGMSVGKRNFVEQRVSTSLDSVNTVFSLYPIK